MASITNPMKSDLDAGLHSITNVNELQVSDAVTANGFFLVGGLTTPFAILGGYIDPTVNGLLCQPGSLYLQRIDANSAAIWFKTGPLPTDWKQVALQP